jgi:hypothetical protein
MDDSVELLMNRLLPAIVIGAVGAIAAACSAVTTDLPPSDGKIALGTWGGDTAGMIVADTSLHLHIGCTFGDVSGRVSLDASGRFDVTGSYMLRAFPIAIGPSVPARFVGRLDGSTLTVTATVNDTVQKQTVVLGPVSVTYLKEPKMRVCPICRRQRM